MLVKLEAEVFTDGTVLIQLKRDDIPISKRLRMSFIINSDKEYMLGFRYIATKNLGFSTHHDSDMVYGLGLTLIY